MIFQQKVKQIFDEYNLINFVLTEQNVLIFYFITGFMALNICANRIGKCFPQFHFVIIIHFCKNV